MSPGRLLLAATPLGLPTDASARLISGLSSADVVAAEDTRRVRTLAQALDVRIAGRVISLFDQNEATRVPALVDEIKGGATVLVVSDAGMPRHQRPRLPAGFGLCGGRATSELPAGAVGGDDGVGGLRAARRQVLFRGLCSRKQSARKTWLTVLADEQRTAVFFESPRRLAACLQDAVEVLGPQRRAVVCRELTKTHEK